jgi:phage baseplate assembly protein gpV
MAGCTLPATVTKVREDRVQVSITGDENARQEIDIWYPYATVYSTPDGTGWYCMPEPGDTVRLTIPQQQERDAFVTSSVHVETDSADRKDPSHKVFKSRYQKEVRFTPDSIVITNNRGTMIELTDAEGIRIVSAHSVMLEAAEDLTITSDTGSLIVAGDSSVNFKQKGTSIQLDNGISFAGGNLKIQ